MLISCLCPTFNRYPHSAMLVEEALECFLRQDYPEKELIICNDTPGQYLRCSDPRVRVINLQERCPTLSDKIQFMIEAAQGDLLCRWDDDDISLPWRLTYSFNKRFEKRWEWRPGNYWYAERGKKLQEVHHPGNTHVMSLWHRDVLSFMDGKYPVGLSGIEDQAFNAALAKAGFGTRGEIIPTSEMYYIYRWGVSAVHLSGKVGGTPENPHQEHYDAIGRRPIEMGQYLIRPRWREEYTKLIPD